MLKIATWNVNSLRVRLEHVLAWLKEHQPDVLALQETKVTDDKFPVDEFIALGYQVTFSGQPTYNGVALLSKEPLSTIDNVLPGMEDDPQKRFLAGTYEDIRIINVYVPNGAVVNSNKYLYKLKWLEALYKYAIIQNAVYDKAIIVGDFNIAPKDADVHDPEEWVDKILVSPAERDALESLHNLGFIDTYRQFEQEENSFSWWDYRAASFRRNRGLRIDLILTNQILSTFCKQCHIDVEPRRLEKPSDHAPVWAYFEE